jgi:hypothetical protein
MIHVMGSSNKIQAIKAVVGGVKYIKLVTLVAAPLRIKINNKEIAPIEMAKTPHSMAPIISGTHSTSIVSNISINGAQTKTEAAN